MSSTITNKPILQAALSGVLVGFLVTAAFFSQRQTSVSLENTSTSRVKNRTELVMVPPKPDQPSLEEELERITQKWIELAREIALTFEPTVIPIDLLGRSKIPREMRGDRRPFVFFHQRKAGGSSIRTLLKDASDQHHLNSYIPCLTIPLCRIYTLPLEDDAKRPQHAIYGGHLTYSSAVNTLQFDLTTSGGARYFTYETQRDDYQSRTFDCLTNIREPLGRVVSSWNYRQIHNGAPASSEMNATEWDRLLPLAFSEYGYGNNNEPARLFGGLSTEQEVNTLTSFSANDTNASEPRSIIVANELETVLSRISTCVIYSQERCEDSKKIAEHFLPWFDSINCSLHLKPHNPKWTEGGLQPGAAGVIKKHNLIEFHAYNFSMALFDQLLEVATGNTTFSA